VQHSQARNATIPLKREGDELVLCIRDDGKGFNVSQLTGVAESGRGAGLFSMKAGLSLKAAELVVKDVILREH